MDSATKYLTELENIEVELIRVDEQIKELNKTRSLLAHKKNSLQRKLDSCLQSSSSNAEKAQNDWIRNDYGWSKASKETLHSVFEIENFRSVQLAAINATMSKKDCIVVMPTGGGKSLCFQLPAVISKGFTLVISPLISLVEDQLMKLTSLHIEAATLNASTTKEEVSFIMKKMVDSKSLLKLLYATPEKLAKSNRFMNKLEKANEMGLLARVAVDEVHCCSHWGHDFRPDYKFLSVLKRQFPKVPILGLTATASSDVLEDVMKMLSIPGALILRAPLNRPNLFYEVHKKPTSNEEIMNTIHSLVTIDFKGKSGIVYCLTQKDSQEVADDLKRRGVKAGCYHANMDAKARNRIHTMWTENSLQVVVATVAFGMGIDKPDVRFVIHHSISKSMENYYQESGRAGRDEGTSRCILLAGFSDIFRQSTMVFRENTGLEKLYGMISYAFNTHECRRSLIAFHFGEGWKDCECNNMCDHCSEDHSSEKRDVTNDLQEFLEILGKSEKLKQRLTALKLLDTWLGKGNASLRVGDKKSKENRSREDGEQMMVHFLLEGYLKESFHFTPYSTISYIVPGNSVKRLSSGQKVEMFLKSTKAKTKSLKRQKAKIVDVIIESDSDEPSPKKKKL